MRSSGVPRPLDRRSAPWNSVVPERGLEGAHRIPRTEILLVSGHVSSLNPGRRPAVRPFRRARRRLHRRGRAHRTARRRPQRSGATPSRAGRHCRGVDRQASGAASISASVGRTGSPASEGKGWPGSVSTRRRALPEHRPGAKATAQRPEVPARRPVRPLYRHQLESRGLRAGSARRRRQRRHSGSTARPRLKIESAQSRSRRPRATRSQGSRITEVPRCPRPHAEV